MRKPTISSRAGVIAAASLLVAAAAGAQSYGSGSQVLTIGAVEFRREFFGEDPNVRSDGYVYARSPSAASSIPESRTVEYYRAPVALPDGAGIERLCLWANDGQEVYDLRVALIAVKLAYGGESPDWKEIGLAAETNSDVGYRKYCQEFSETVRGRRDVDEDGGLDPVTYYVQLYMPTSGNDQIGFGGVQITWRRQVSAAPAAPSFADVPESHPFYPFIEALAAAGITGGCGSGNFCPNAPLKRGQMAAFLAKALGLHWPD